MAEKTVREQMAAALDLQLVTAGAYVGLVGELLESPDLTETRAAIRAAEAALDRHRAEPEHKCSLRDCGFGCPCYQEGRDEGLEAQREPAGRGTA